MQTETFAAIRVPAIVVQLSDSYREGLHGGVRYVARAFHADGTYTDSISMTQAGAARIVAALANR